MVDRWQSVLTRCKCEPRLLPILLSLVRVAICFWPQRGYIHPDEFFQSSNVIGGNYFSSQVQTPWEFTTSQPIRCMLIPNILVYPAFWIVEKFTPNPGAYILLVMPRLAYTMLSFVVDFCLYKMCSYYSSRGLWYLPVSIIYQSSFICLECLGRSLTNSIETVLFAILLVLVCYTIKPRFRIFFVTPSRTMPACEQIKKSKQIISSATIGLVLALGTFNRPTFPAFAFAPMLYWISESAKQNSYNTNRTVIRVLLPLGFSAALSAILISSYDTFYYKGYGVLKDAMTLLATGRLGELIDLVVSKWVFTPQHFISFNTSVENLRQFTLHPPYFHVLVNMPLAFNILAILFYQKLIDLMIGPGTYRLIFSTHRIYALMMLSCVTSLIMLSFIPHQEFRFLFPLIVPLAYIFGFTIYTSNKWLSVWIVINVCLSYFYGNVHQSGVVQSVLDLDPILKSHRAIGDDSLNIHIIGFRSYNVPTYAWNLPLEDTRFHLDLMETHDDFRRSVNHKLNRWLDQQVNSEDDEIVPRLFYIMMPSIFESKLTDMLSDRYPGTGFAQKLQPVTRNWPHFTGEDLIECVDHMKDNGLYSWKTAFGYSLMVLDLRN